MSLIVLVRLLILHILYMTGMDHNLGTWVTDYVAGFIIWLIGVIVFLAGAGIVSGHLISSSCQCPLAPENRIFLFFFYECFSEFYIFSFLALIFICFLG